ncbi:CPBP family intramembrane glutamic endopeptidase [Halorarius litoreus]|jgi:membrane protease YdiL (CAAX protease family)|uniref:CPBP family intramembrane glutamic endopeptidase n=1 Tax=Halorarius litoreus TaxID=2962676 RepID=UPI0020CBEC66|nr:type II CAAX endopeptidase family protein [Halorarius litoreus]
MASLSPRIRSVLSALGLTFGSFILGAVVLAIVGGMLSAFGVNVVNRPSLQLFLSTVLLQGVTFGGVAVIYLKVRNLDLDFVPFSIPNWRELGITVLGILALLAILIVASSVISYFGLDAAQNQITEIGQQNPTVFLVLIPLSFLLVGPGEELLFRGIIQGTLRESFHPARAIVLASLLFASIHLFSLSGDGKLVYIGLVFVLALVLGASYEYTDNLVVPALIHGAYNAAQFASAYLAATGA